MKLTAPPKSVLDSCIRSLSIFFFLAALSATASAQNTIHVPADAPTIQDAINAASNGDTVLVSPGTYYEAINFSGKAITLTSTDGAASTIIDGSQLGCCFSDVTFNRSETQASVLNGFTVQNANGQPPQAGPGYGIEINGASPTITNNIITNNHGGGGINVDSGNPQILNNTITNNNGYYGGAIYLNGSEAAAVIQNNYIAGNVASGGGGGIGVVFYGFPSQSSSLILQNIIVNNSAGQSGSSPGGGGIYVQGSHPQLINNTLYGNSATDGNAGILINSAPNTVVINNVVTVDSGIAISCNFNGDTSTTFAHNLGHSPSFYSWDPTCASGPGANGNLAVDPQYADAPNGNYHLATGSPAIDAGDFTVDSLPSLDYAGNARLGDTGGQCNFSIDLGVYESHSALPGALDVSPLSLTFPDTLVGTSSAQQQITLNNSAQGCYRIASYNISGDFTQSNSCAASGVPAGQSCTVQASFAPTATGLRTGAFSILLNSGTPPAPVALSGSGINRHGSASPGTLAFGSQGVNTASTSHTVTLTNDGGSYLNIYSIFVPANYAQSNNTCGPSLAPAASCSLEIVFVPSTVGQLNGVISITTDSDPAIPNVSLSGMGIAPAASLAPSSLTFTTQRVGMTSAAQGLTLSNTGSSALNISSIVASGAFAQNNNCPAALAAGNFCSISVTFHPTANGTASGSIVVTDDSNGVAGSTQAASLSGTGGSSTGNASSSSITFATTKVGTASAGSIVTLSNTGTMPLNVSSISVSGDFSQTNNCPASVAASGSCQITVIFTPTATGSRSGTLTINDDSQTGSTQTVSLSGTGAAPQASITPASLSFVTTAVGSQSASSPITFSNTGTAAMNVASITTTGDFTQTNNCPAVLGMGASCTIDVEFVPTAGGTRTGTLTVTDDASGGSQSASLTGSAIDFSLTVSPASFSVSAGSTATYTATASPIGGAYNQTVSLTCSGAPIGAACTLTPTSVVPGSSSKTSQVKITTTKNGRTPTPKGTYSIVVSGVANGVTRSATVTLVVQ